MSQKEELRKRFVDLIKSNYPNKDHDFIDDRDVDLTVDFFYSEIEKLQSLRG